MFLDAKPRMALPVYSLCFNSRRKDVNAMKISSSSIGMSSNRVYSKQEESSSISIMRWENANEAKREQSAEVTISEQAKENYEKMKKEAQDEAKKSMAQSVAKRVGQSDSVAEVGLQQEDPRIQMLKRILEILRNIRSKGGLSYPSLDSLKSGMKQQKAGDGTQMTGLSLGSSQSTTFSIAGLGSQRTLGGTNGVWTRQTVESSFTSEKEATAYTSVGTVQTEDGRSIQFNVSMEMSRSFEQATALWSEEKQVVFCDPLVINMDGNVADVKDQKFYFDLDADGEKEEISQLGSKSGYLAYDKNEDGIINDGNELFGTKSGDGFADLSAYDQDKNGWIDENDTVFSKLKVWTKDENGNDKLLDLKSANVGAIYLGRSATEFSMNNMETNATNAQIRSTGVCLKESGGVSTIQHVDMAV